MVIFNDRYAWVLLYHVKIHQCGMSRAPKITLYLHSGPELLYAHTYTEWPSQAKCFLRDRGDRDPLNDHARQRDVYQRVRAEQ